MLCALAVHAEEALQRLVNCLARACNEFGLTISLKKTNIMDQNASHIPNISIGDYTLEVVDTFTCLGPTIASNLSLDDELNSRIGKTATAMARLARRVWNNSMLIINTKMKVHQACVLSTLLYSSEILYSLLLAYDVSQLTVELAEGRYTSLSNIISRLFQL